MRKKAKLPKFCWLYVKKDISFYALILASFIVGGIVAAVFAFTLPELTCKELALYLEDFFNNMNQNGADASALFHSGIVSHLKNFVFLFFFSVTVIGSPFLIGFAAVKGFMHFFTLLLFFRLYSFRALLFLLLGMLPHYLLLIPCYLGICAACLKFSVSIFIEKNDFKKTIPRLLLILAAFFLVAIMTTLLQAYIEPPLIRLIAGLFLP